MKIVTISREFGSGGRELGKRLADQLGMAYYDRELVSAIARQSQMSEAYVSRVLEQGGTGSYPLTFRRTLSWSGMIEHNAMKVLLTQQKVIQALPAREEDFVIVGRSADVLLREYRPLNLFVYADMASKLARCRERAPAGENLTDRELARKIKQVDEGRAKYRQLLTNSRWGSKESYHLCLNTTGQSIKELTCWVADYTHYWFGRTEQ